MDLATNPVEVSLNADGLAALNASRGGSFAAGGDYPGGQVAHLFAATNSTYVPRLIPGIGNTAPVASSFAATAQKGKVATISLAGHVYDAEGDALAASIVSMASVGTCAVPEDQLVIVYSAAKRWTGQDTCSYQVYDGQAYSATATATIDVANGKPKAR